jgi:hypothetical protein
MTSGERVASYRNGRPVWVHESPAGFTYRHYKTSPLDMRGWRREHAHRVWQAIATILQGIACLHVGAYAAAGDDTKIRAIYLACGWREP